MLERWMPNHPIWATAHCAVRGQCQPVATHALKTGTLPAPAQLPCRALLYPTLPAGASQRAGYSQALSPHNVAGSEFFASRNAQGLGTTSTQELG